MARQSRHSNHRDNGFELLCLLLETTDSTGNRLPAQIKSALIAGFELCDGLTGTKKLKFIAAHMKPSISDITLEKLDSSSISSAEPAIRVLNQVLR